MSARFVIDSSAWWRARRGQPGADRFEAELLLGRLLMTDVVRFEVLYSARNAQEFVEMREELSSFDTAQIDPATWARSLEVYEALAQRGGNHHRQVGHMDLLIAAAAEQAGATLLHYDSDFDNIAEITGQPTEWIAPRGSI
ncbi:MAG: PIN domain-containing protein [Thermoleophilia bacterium]|nr:PIN domain-containing protein [Thermoleophilia bacterium]